MLKIKIYVSSLARYTEGRENGRWLSLPMEEESLKKVLNEIVGKNAEHIILDHDAPFEIGEYENILSLNNMVSELQLTGLENDVLQVLFKVGDNKEETFEKIMEDEYSIIDVDYAAKDWNCADSEKCGLVLHELELITTFNTPVPKDLIDYIDWESVFRDESINCGWREVRTDNTTYLVRF